MRHMGMIVVAVLVASCGKNPASPTAATSRATSPDTSGQSVQYVVSGVVLDAATSQPIEGATVKWSGSVEDWGSNPPVETAVTDQSGRYEMPFAGEAGEVILPLRVTKDGYLDESRTVTLEVPSQTTVDFTLTRHWSAFAPNPQ